MKYSVRVICVTVVADRHHVLKSCDMSRDYSICVTQVMTTHDLFCVCNIRHATVVLTVNMSPVHRLCRDMTIEYV